MQENPTLGMKIKKFRESRDFTQLELEMQMNAASGSLSRIESDENNPTKETLLKIVQILNLNALEIAHLFSIDAGNFKGLLAVQNKLTPDLDTKSILQRAVNDICYELNLLGSFITLVEGDYVYLKTFTQTTWTEKCLNILPLPVHMIKASLKKDTQNLIVKAINTKKSYFSYDHTQFLVPCVSKTIAKLLTQIPGVKAGIAFPLIYNDSALGAIYFAKSYRDEFELEKDTLEAFSNYISVIIAHRLEVDKLKEQLREYVKS